MTVEKTYNDVINEFKLKNKIKEIDKNAFITVGEVHEVMGEGFIGIDED